MKQQQNTQQEDQIKNYDKLINEVRILVDQMKPSLPQPQQFEKDDDLNHQISFITQATNRKALNYGIPQADWMWPKLKAGRIIPAMLITTFCCQNVTSR